MILYDAAGPVEWLRAEIRMEEAHVILGGDMQVQMPRREPPQSACGVSSAAQLPGQDGDERVGASVQ